jgi:hypothetical protein
MSCMTDGWETKTRIRRVPVVLAGAAILGSLLVLFLLSQPTDAAQQPSHFGGVGVPTVHPPALVPAVVAPKPIAAPVAPIAAPAATEVSFPALRLQSERIWRLRVFGFTVFRYDAKVERVGK